MIDDLIAQLDALGEDDFYYSPATTKAKINEAKAALKSQAARIAELKLALNAVHRHAMGQSGDRTFDQCSAALGYIDDICRAALEGGEDE